ncbi:MAG: nickel pincer cofactor biosynthesis protein LarB [Spartobacteria bacterium]|nr:nickel pincer cofactor biosynthesis protein LarB [Spartobacteria bacterium]
MDMEQMLNSVADGSLSPAEALQRLQSMNETDMGFARLDLNRLKRRGLPEVIYCPGKTPEQVCAICTGMIQAGQNVLATRAPREIFDVVIKAHPDARYHEQARAITLDVTALPAPRGHVVVMTAGTVDIPVAEEACLVAERMGARVTRLYDVGVAGLHRLLNRLEVLKDAVVVIVVAGMEGALPSVVAGLIDKPVIAVPTSAGYGLNLDGVAAFLTMINSCVPGISVVNIDNGFGAGVSAAMINRLADSTTRETR